MRKAQEKAEQGLMRILERYTTGSNHIDSTDKGLQFLRLYPNISSQSAQLPLKCTEILALEQCKIPRLQNI